MRDTIATALEWHAYSRLKLERDRWSVQSVEGELAMRGIIQANIDRFKLLLKTEPDSTKRAMEIRLLAEEEAKQVPKLQKKEA